MNTTNFTTQMNGTWVVGDEVLTDTTLTVPTFPVCCIHRGQKEGGGGLIGNCYPYGAITSSFNAVLTLYHFQTAKSLLPAIRTTSCRHSMINYPHTYYRLFENDTVTPLLVLPRVNMQVAITIQARV